MKRRSFLLTSAVIPSVLASVSCLAEGGRTDSTEERLAVLEQAFGGRLGVFALDTADGGVIAHRGDERFPLCSTFKVILAGAVLARAAHVDGLLQRRIDFSREDLVHYSPLTERHLADGMSVSDLCAAALQYSDNTAANLLMKLLGGPAAVTAYAASIGNDRFRLDRWETELNSCLPGDPRDTATPETMARSLRSLVLGEALPAAGRQQLGTWLRGNTTGAKRIRAALPPSWAVGDKTGSGAYGTANDIAVLWPPGRPPLLLAVYSTQERADAKWNDGLIATAARIAMDGFGMAQPRRAD
ncbi:class A beta-lactamase [Endothiovibrio diazotrophicus]